MTTALETPDRTLPGRSDALRCLLGGLLMGLANLVPGISGGTMLLSAGVYPVFIDGISEITTLRFRPRTILLLALIVGAAASAILLFAGSVKGLVVDQRWAMYSLFIGLTLGGVPVIWKLLKPATLSAWVGCAAGIAVMALMAVLQPGASSESGHSYLILFIAGLAGASAMILPGISGGYLLLIMGQYLPILGAIDQAKTALLNPGGPNWTQVFDAFHVFIPVGIGVVGGVIGVSNLIRMLLARFGKPTLGALLGLLLGAVLGLWPFQAGVAPQPGDIIKGQVLTAETVAEVDPDDYPVEYFSPSAGQVAASIGLIAVGFAVTQGVSRLGKD